MVAAPRNTKGDKVSQYRKDFREFQGDYYWTLPRLFFISVATVALICALGFGLNAVGFANFAFWSPKYEAVRRDVQIQSRAYSEGQTREIYKLKLQYLQSKDDDERATIRAMALHEASAFDRSRLPLDLQSFILQLGG